MGKLAIFCSLCLTIKINGYDFSLENTILEAVNPPCLKKGKHSESLETILEAVNGLLSAPFCGITTSS